MPGFTSKPIVREDELLVREVSRQSREFAFTVPNERSPEEESKQCHESA
jgi:hypothetical protein